MKFLNRYFEEETFLPIVGPLLLLPTLMLADRTVNYDLLLLALVGTFLCFHWGLRGCAYALVMLAMSGSVKHLWVTEAHLWQLGLEGSVGLSFLISTLSSEQMAQFFALQKQHGETRAQTIAHLEEELKEERSRSAEEQAVWAEKLSGERAVLEEAQTELFSVTVLNEVLRNSHAAATQGKEKLADEILQLERLVGQQRLELDALQQELTRLSTEETLVQQNKALFKELNAARMKEAQTHLINETLARLHAKVVGEKEELRGQLEAVVKEKLVVREPPGQYEQLYKQLKGQFEEKTNLLHQTRKELFRADNELQTLKLALENEALEVDPLPVHVREEIERVVDENRMLEELVTHLMHQEGVSKKAKKKVDEASVQDLLF